MEDVAARREASITRRVREKRRVGKREQVFSAAGFSRRDLE